MMMALERWMFGGLVVWVAVAMAVGCAPPELLEVDDAGQVEEVGEPDVESGDVAEVGDDADAGQVEEVAFGDIASLVRTSCSAVGTCHGSSSITNFEVEGNSTATDAQVREALEDVDTLTAGKLVEPGEPQQSAFYTRMLADDSQAMPPTGPLPTEDIEMVELWINQGATYE